ncbi:hypothetical protein SCO12_09905 [Legionella pneumophila serogroup 10]
MNKELLDIYSDYLISQGGHATATGLSSLLNEEISHDKVSRFLRADDYGSKELWHYVKADVQGKIILCLEFAQSRVHF